MNLANPVLLAQWVPVVLPALLANLAMMVKLANLEKMANVVLPVLRVLAASQEPQDFQE